MFVSDLCLKADPVPDQWIVCEPLVWVDKTYGRHVVPVGFRTDLASTPWHVDDNGPSRMPAVMHDAFYNLGQRLGRDYADAFLRDALLACGGGPVRSWVYYRAVRAFGGIAWRSAAREPGQQHFETAAAYMQWLTSTKTLRD